MSSDLIAALSRPQAYPHRTNAIKLIETHISWVFLTGEYAYKIKKPLDLGFLDFSTLEKRLQYCREELRLNRRLAPDLYLNVAPITLNDTYAIDGAGEIVEYAVRMRQFPQEQMLEQVMARGGLRDEHIDRFAHDIADFHAGIVRARADNEHGTPEAITRPMLENFSQILALEDSAKTREMLMAIQDCTGKMLDDRARDILRRKPAGFIRECHGDMHLGNMVLLDDRITLFDCIEFNPNLYWIDVISEIAFFVMDLQHRGHGPLAYRFLNLYMQQTGDYEAVRLLSLYLMYRAMVRAKVSKIHLRQEGVTAGECHELRREYLAYLHQAKGYSQKSSGCLIITHGVSGSGKTRYSLPLACLCQAIHLRSDIERKRLFGLTAEESSGSGIDSGIYTGNATEQTYQRLGYLARFILESGFSVIADATFLERAHRDCLHRIADEMQVPFIILKFHAPKERLMDNIRQRLAQGRDASEAGVAVLEKQLLEYRPLGEDEQPYVIDIDISRQPTVEGLHSGINEMIGARMKNRRS